MTKCNSRINNKLLPKIIFIHENGQSVTIKPVGIILERRATINFNATTMKNFLTAYELLGIEPNATDDQINSAFRNKAKEYHPDKNGNSGMSNNMFQYIKRAKDLLLNPATRLEHDYATGIKLRPKPLPRTITVKQVQKEADWNIAIGLGLLGLLAGALIGSSTSSGK